MTGLNQPSNYTSSVLQKNAAYQRKYDFAAFGHHVSFHKPNDKR